MKRDARIGLAVVLVLGLAVTLLVARAIYRNGDAGDEAESLALPANSDTTPLTQPNVVHAQPEASRVDGVSVLGLEAAASRAPAEVVSPAPGLAEAQPAVQAFIHEQTRPLAGTPNGNPNANPNGGTPAPKLTPEQLAVADHEMAPPSMSSPVKSVNASAPEFFAYTVALGDNMYKISSKVYGDGKYAQKIVDANTGLNVKRMMAGNTIKIPAIPNKTILLKLPAFGETQKSPATDALKTETTTAETGKSTRHKIESGETLSSIAKKYYGSGGPKAIARITDANKGVDATRLQTGQELVIPALTTAAK